MKILNLSTYDYGGAGKAAYRLHHNFLDAGLDSKLMVLNKRSADTSVVGVSEKSNMFMIKKNLGKVFLKLRTNQNYYFQQQSRFNVRKIVSSLIESGFKPDIIVAHWISNFLTAEDLYQLHEKTGAPVIWYLMDMAPLTGGCHYAWDCIGYTDKCGNCPALYSTNRNDLSHRNWEKKYDAHKKNDLTVVAATGWLYEQARNATVLSGKRIDKIMLAVDPKIFSPISKEIARAKLNLPIGKKIIFVGSQALNLERKGIKYFLEALHILANQSYLDKENILVAIAGEGKEIEAHIKNSFQSRHLGFLNDDKMLASAYQAADLFVCPSIEDSGPMMINESILCGTPVVSFDMGVAPDLVHTGKTGYRAALKNIEDLAKGIEYILGLSSEELGEMSGQCRALGMELCCPQGQAESFNVLFRSMLNRKL